MSGGKAEMAVAAVVGAAAAFALLSAVNPVAHSATSGTASTGRVAATAPIVIGAHRLPAAVAPQVRAQAAPHGGVPTDITPPSLTGPAVLLTAGAALLAAGTAMLTRRQRAPSSDPIAEYRILMSTGTKAPPANLAIHLYDHCPYCIRVELFLAWNSIKYNRVVYGYGDKEGPTKLIGKKQLPVLTGDGAPYPPGMNGMPESLDMINWLSREFHLPILPGSGRKDYVDWQKKAKNVIAGLMRPRLLQMPFRDFALPEDIEYATAKWAKKGFNVEKSLADTPKLLVEMEGLLRELEPMVQGPVSLNREGLGMDDLFLLPDLRRLTVVRDLKWPPRLRQYVDYALSPPLNQSVSYAPWAL
jgi:glutaredoxin 2